MNGFYNPSQQYGTGMNMAQDWSRNQAAQAQPQGRRRPMLNFLQGFRNRMNPQQQAQQVQNAFSTAQVTPNMIGGQSQQDAIAAEAARRGLTANSTPQQWQQGGMQQPMGMGGMMANPSNMMALLSSLSSMMGRRKPAGRQLTR